MCKDWWSGEENVHTSTSQTLSYKSPGDPIKMQILVSRSWVGLRFCIFKFLVVADTTGSWVTFEGCKVCRNKVFFFLKEIVQGFVTQGTQKMGLKKIRL